MGIETVSGLLRASRLLSSPVVNPSGEKLGSLDEVVLDLESGRVAYAVLSFGGFLGIGDKLFAIPWHMLQVDGQNERFVLDVPREVLRNAPGFDPDRWPDMGDRQWGRSLHGYYGVTPYWETHRSGTGV